METSFVEYRYTWSKQDGDVGDKQTDTATEMMEFIVGGDKDRTLYAETKGVFMAFSSETARWTKIKFADVIRHCMAELRVGGDSEIEKSTGTEG